MSTRYMPSDQSSDGKEMLPDHCGNLIEVGAASGLAILQCPFKNKGHCWLY